MMTKDNISDMMDLLVACYGEKAYNVDSPEKMAKAMNLWTVMFQDDDPAEVLMAVKDCIATLQFPPKIADIKSRIGKQRTTGQMTEMEAWQTIVYAIERSYGKDDANKQFYQLPAILQKLVGSPSQLRAWRLVETAQLETVVMSAVMRSYRELAQREAVYHQLPADIQKQEEWRLPKPVMATLPEPKRQETWDEMDARIAESERAYRERYGIKSGRDVEPLGPGYPTYE